MKDLKDRIQETQSYPDVRELGNGWFQGAMSGCQFTFEGKVYRCPFGVRGINIPSTIQIVNEEVIRM